MVMKVEEVIEKNVVRDMSEGEAEVIGSIEEAIERNLSKEKIIEMYGPEEYFRKKWPLVEDVKGKGHWVSVRSKALSDTPKCLYRFLYIWEPKKIDFSDMYKSSIALIDLEEKAIVKLALFKYELAAYLYVPPEDVLPREVHAIEISCGIPGVDEEELTKESKANEVFQDFIDLLEQEHDVYPGNFFRV